MIFDAGDQPPVRPWHEVLRRSARAGLRAELSQDDPGMRARQEWEARMEHAANPWMGGRHVTLPSGRCVWMTAGQQARIADALANRPPGQRLALY
jgi:hypothetical protein